VPCGAGWICNSCNRPQLTFVDEVVDDGSCGVRGDISDVSWGELAEGMSNGLGIVFCSLTARLVDGSKSDPARRSRAPQRLDERSGRNESCC